MIETQETLNKLYKWVENNGMEINSGKMYCMRIGNLNPEGNNYIAPDGNKIKFVESIKDLGITIDNNGGFRSHLNKVISKCKRYQNWLTRTFENRSIEFMRFLYQTYIQPNTDYGSQVWSPVKLSEIDALESILRIWTRKIPYIRDMHFWDRLEAMKMSSIQRSHERCLIIYTWQMLENKVINNGNIKAVWTNYKGRKVVIPSPKGKESTRTLRNNAFTVRGGNLFNSCPMEVRNYSGKVFDHFLMSDKGGL